MAPLRRASLAVLLLTLAALRAHAQDVSLVVVTNLGSVVNGDTRNIPALNANPGSDGISFAEALEAANRTNGPKVITFAPELMNKTIELANTPDDSVPFKVEVPDLTIDGDLDQNGTPDVTLASARNSVVAFLVRTSRFTMRGIRLISNFEGAAINVSCADLTCDEHALRAIHLVNNDITNNQGPAIEIGPEFVRPSDLPLITDAVYDDILISGNIISVGTLISAPMLAISVAPAGVGLSGIRATNIRIEKNRITAGTGVRASAADRSSPPVFSENNVLDGLTIDQNAFEVTGTAISVFAANWGNSNNLLSNLQITSNQITKSKNGIDVAAVMEGKPQRVGRGNVIENATIAANQITATGRGITVSGVDVPIVESDSFGFDSNHVRHLTIRDNTISGYTDSGIRLWGGLANVGTVTSNTVEDVTVMNNTATAATKQAVGIAVVGGEARGGTARANAIRGVSVTGNRVSGNGTGILFIGGAGGQALSNTVDVLQITGNDLTSNDVTVAATENSNSAGGNSVRFRRRRAVR